MIVCYEIPISLNENPQITIAFVFGILWIAQSTDQSNKFSIYTVYRFCSVDHTSSETRTVLNACSFDMSTISLL